MSQSIRILLMQYLTELQKIYGSHLKSVILYGSYARGIIHRIQILILCC